MQLSAVPLSPSPGFGLSSHNPHPLLQPRVAMVVQLLTPLRRHDPSQPVPSTRATLKPGQAALQAGAARPQALPAACPHAAEPSGASRERQPRL